MKAWIDIHVTEHAIRHLKISKPQQVLHKHKLYRWTLRIHGFFVFCFSDGTFHSAKWKGVIVEGLMMLTSIAHFLQANHEVCRFCSRKWYSLRDSVISHSCFILLAIHFFLCLWDPQEKRSWVSSHWTFPFFVPLDGLRVMRLFLAKSDGWGGRRCDKRDRVAGGSELESRELPAHYHLHSLLH